MLETPPAFPPSPDGSAGPQRRAADDSLAGDPADEHRTSLPGSRMNLPWSAEALWGQLEPLLPGLTVEIVASSPSTNTALLDRARVRHDADGVAQVRRSRESEAFRRRAADVQPCLLVAEHQTQGRGRQGRQWMAAPGASLTFSLSMPMNPPSWSGLSLAVGVALAEALQPSVHPTGAPRLGLKWPNDLWLIDSPSGESPARGRKLGGILIETCAVGDSRLAVIGVGLNVLPQPMGEAATGHAWAQELNTAPGSAAVNAPAVLALVSAPLVRALLDFNQEGFAPFAGRFADRDLLFGQPVTTTQPDAPQGVAKGVSARGALRVETPDGRVVEIDSAEVSVRPAAAGVAPC